MLAKIDLRILQLLTQAETAGDPMHVGALVQSLKVSQPFVSQRLRGLQKEGYVDRISVPTSTGRIVCYRPRPAVLIQWVSPAEGVAFQWRAFGEVDWEFPLVSQVPDEPARITLLALLRRLREEDLLLPFNPTAGKKRGSRLGLSVVVYGSCARGTARPGSDVDVMTLQGDGKDTLRARERVEQLAAEVSLEAPRPLQVKHVKGPEWGQLPSWIRESVSKEGLIVFDGARLRNRGSSWGLWRVVYGGRGSGDV